MTKTKSTKSNRYPSRVETTRTRLIKGYGHVCGLGSEPDVLLIHDPFSDNWSWLHRWLRKSTIISELNPRANKYCRSQFALHLEKLKQLNYYKYVLHPISNLRKYWEYFMIVKMTLGLIVRPLLACFIYLPHLAKSTIFAERQCILAVSYIMDTFNIIDIIINFFTGYYNDQREIVLDMKHIAIHYLKTFFVPDFLSSIPHIHSLFGLLANCIIFILKLFRIFRYVQYISHWLEVLQIRNYYCKTILLVITTIVLLHCISCLCIVVSALSVGLESNVNVGRELSTASWLTEHGLHNSSMSLVYFTSLFRTMCIVSSAEYESADASTSSDQWLTCLLWIVTKILYTTFVCLLIQITRSVTSSQSKYKEMVLQLMQYMHHKQLSLYTQRRLIDYYEFRFQKSFFRESEILSTISGQLRQEILMLKCLKLVENVPFFKGLPQSLLMRIVSYLQPEIFLANDIIIKSKSRGSSMYFIGSGTVALYSESGKEIYHLEDGEYFGEIELIMADSARVASVIAIEPCELYRLDRKDFMHVVQPYPDLLLSIEQIAAERLQHIIAIDKKYKFFYEQRHGHSPSIL